MINELYLFQGRLNSNMEIAKVILSRGGIVAGAAYTKDFSVEQ